jgi:hypothetical protein
VFKTAPLSIEMGLNLRPSGLGSGIDKERQDYTVYSGGWDIGRITKPAAARSTLRWDGSFALPGPVTRSDRVASFEEAGPVHAAWETWKACVGEAVRASPAASILQELNMASPD